MCERDRNWEEDINRSTERALLYFAAVGLNITGKQASQTEQ